ncbi:MAG: FAD-dependent oxidoreductase, partial [Victivallales bacterium]|nr:FAD-dependent oxidoreductase [Victivallales bacterium]
FDELHPDSFYCHGRMSTHHVAPIPFGIPYRCLYSRNIANLMFAGRDISCTHIGLSTVRVMATCALLGQAAGTAAAIAVSHGCSPRGVYERHIAELQNTLEDDDVLLPNRWRTPSPLTQTAKSNAPILQNGIDRNWRSQDNGCWLAPGEAAEYSWDSPQSISSIRLIFDSVLSKRGKRMPKLEGLSEYHEMPGVLTRAYHIDIYKDGEWRTVHSETDVIHRLVRVSIPPVNATKVRLVIDATWGAPKAHVFAMDIG